MSKSRIVLCFVGLSLALWAGNASGALIHYWSCDPVNDTSTGLGDSIGGITAVAGGAATFPPARGPGATGTASSAVQAVRNGGTANSGNSGGYVATGLTSLGSVFTFEMMYQWQGPGYNWAYITSRSGGPVTLSRYNSTGVLTLNIGATAIFTTPTGPVWSPTVGSWWDIAVVCDGTTASMYLTPAGQPAVLARQVAFTGNSNSTASQGFGNAEGSKYGGGGYIDWVAISNTALTPAQLTTNSQRNSAVPEPATMGVLALGGLGVLLKRRRR